MLGLIYAHITLTVKMTAFCMEESGGSGVTGGALMMVEVRVNKNLEEQSGNRVKEGRR